MNGSRRQKLARRGWRLGDAGDFLGLDATEAALVELKLELADALRGRRAKAALTQAELARRIGSSQSRVAKMEAGDASVSVDLLVRALLAIGARPKRLAAALG